MADLSPQRRPVFTAGEPFQTFNRGAAPIGVELAGDNLVAKIRYRLNPGVSSCLAGPIQRKGELRAISLAARSSARYPVARELPVWAAPARRRPMTLSEFSRRVPEWRRWA